MNPRALFISSILSVSLSTNAPALGAERCNPYAPDRTNRVDDVLSQAKQVLLVHVRASSSNPKSLWEAENVVYELDVLQVIKGKETRRSITLPGIRAKHDFLFDPSLLDVTYRHAIGLKTANKLYDAKVSRLRVPLVGRREYCEYAPYFEVGLDYLVLLGAPYTQISFEPIISPDDDWLARVRSTFKDENRETLFGD